MARAAKEACDHDAKYGFWRPHVSGRGPQLKAPCAVLVKVALFYQGAASMIGSVRVPPNGSNPDSGSVVGHFESREVPPKASFGRDYGIRLGAAYGARHLVKAC